MEWGYREHQCAGSEYLRREAVGFKFIWAMERAWVSWNEGLSLLFHSILLDTTKFVDDDSEKELDVDE